MTRGLPHRLIAVLIMFALVLCLPVAAVAKQAVPVAEDPVLEARMMSLAEELRCLVCQNQTLADSHAPLAADFRREIRDLMKEGKSDEEVVEFLVARYGDFVRYRPSMSAKNMLLWFGPFVLLIVGVIVMLRTLKRRQASLRQETALSDEEERRALELLDIAGDKTGDKAEGERT